MLRTSPPPSDFRVNMAASMASQAAARGLRAAATSKHLFLDKIKVLCALISLRMTVLCPPSVFFWRVYVVVALGSRLCSDVASRLACLAESLVQSWTVWLTVTQMQRCHKWHRCSCSTDKDIRCSGAFLGSYIAVHFRRAQRLWYFNLHCMAMPACLQSVRLTRHVTRRVFIELKCLKCSVWRRKWLNYEQDAHEIAADMCAHCPRDVT